LNEEGDMYHICPVCGYKYEERCGRECFADLPETWRCPVCNEKKERFTEQGRQVRKP
jgi:rubredoxin